MVDLPRLGFLQKWSGSLQTNFAWNDGGHASPPSQNGSSERIPRGPADGLHALLVEDQTIIALDTESMLLDLGAASVHSFTTVDAALTWLAAAKPDIGVLDISLGNTTSFPLADALRHRAMPFMFTTGYGDSALIPERFLDVPIARKPYTLQSLADAVAKCMRQRRLDT